MFLLFVFFFFLAIGMDVNLHYPKTYRACEHVCGVGGLAIFAGSAKGNFCMY